MVSSLVIKIKSHIRNSRRLIAAPTIGQSVFAASLFVTSLVLGVRNLGGLQLLELRAFDQMIRLQPSAEPDPRILVVAITEADIQAQNRWPLSDQTVAQVLAKLQKYRPKVIGLDIHRNIPQLPGRQALLKEIQATNIITINELGDTNSEGVPSLPGVPQERIGFNDFVLDPDGVVRRNFMYAFQGKDKFYSFSLQLSRRYLGTQGSLKVTPNFLQLGKTVFTPLEANSGGYHNIDALGYQILLSYRSPLAPARRVTLTQVLNGQVNPAWVQDKIVLIGSTAPSLKDLFLTPYSAVQKANPGMSGVVLHAQLLSQILSTVLDRQPLFWFWHEWGEALWIWAWSLLGGILAWRLRHPFSLGLTGIVALVSLLGICYGIFTQAGWIPLLPPALALVITGASVIAYKLLHNTFYDALTGLPNREMFLKQLQRAIAPMPNRASLAVLFLDIDRFKIVNNSLGHSTGDQLLVKATSRLKLHLYSTDVLARVGGDEFAILLKNIKNVREATCIADQLQKELSFPFRLAGEEIFTSVSIGIALNQAEHTHQPEELLRDAHTAMYRAKALGKARYEVFAAGMHIQDVKRMQLETELRRSLVSRFAPKNHEFQLHYQPIVSLLTGRIAGFEALVRWQHPQHGFISPEEFIPVAEETGLIIELGKWIFQEACRQLAIWQVQFPVEPPLTLSVNLSGEQFSQPDLVEYIKQTLKTTKLDGRSLKLEITESVAMKDVESTIALLLRLRKLNLRLSIDDFGTGYSSLSYLHRFPIDTLKVDRSFVSRMGERSEDAAIVQTIVILSHTLGMDVVAEGVETAAQQAQLQTLNCEYGQGYFFSQPLNSEAAAALLATQPQW